MTEVHAEHPSAVLPFHDPSRRRRLLKIVAWLVVIVLLLIVLRLLGVDVWGWIKSVWDTLTEISAKYLVVGYIFQTLQTTLTALAWYFILRAGFPRGSVTYLQILAAYAAGVALNGFLPANLGTLVMLLMFVAFIPATFAGVLGAMVVEKIFFTVIGTAVYLYLFLSVPGTYNLQLKIPHDYPGLTVLCIAGGVILIVILCRIFWPRVKVWWEKAKHGGAILAHPRDYFLKVVLPSAGAWLSKLAVIAVFLAAYGIPVTFHTVMSIVGGNSLANTVSATPGGIGINQAVNTASLAHVTTASNATAYSLGQQLAVTAWNIAFAVVVVIWAFGWSGGKRLIGDSYADAKVRVVEQKAEREERKEEKRERRAQEKAEGVGFVQRVRDSRKEDNAEGGAE
jgi:uncharacterized membrane protein YbhN (UPF0104 family)